MEIRISARVQTDPVAQTVTYKWVQGLRTGVKQPGRGVEHLPHLAPRLKKSRAITLKSGSGSPDRS